MNLSKCHLHINFAVSFIPYPLCLGEIRKNVNQCWVSGLDKFVVPLEEEFKELQVPEGHVSMIAALYKFVLHNCYFH